MEIKIDGVVDTEKNPVSEEEFWEMFIEWIEKNKWYFGGAIEELKDD